MTRFRSRRTSLVLMVTWLTFVWIALWEDASASNVAVGMVLAVVLVTVFPTQRRALAGSFRPAAAVRFALHFCWKLVEANLVVLWEVVTPHNKINQGIVAVRIRGVSDALTTLVANAISLTPGTLTIEVRQRPTVLYVHVLHLHDIAAVRRDVQYLEVLAIRAFGSADAVAAAESDLVELGGEVPSAVGPARDRDEEEGK